MPRNYADEGTVRSTSSSSDQVHYLHSGTVRSKLIVLKPESTFTSESDRRSHHHHQGREDSPTPHGSPSNSENNKSTSYLASEPGTHGRLSLLEERLTSGHLIPRQRCTRKLCLSLAVAVISVVFGAAVGVYFGFRILESETTKVKEFRGVFRVMSGDNYTEELVDMFSNEFLSKSRLYKAKLDTIFANSVLKKAYLGSEVLAIDPGDTPTGEDIFVRFNIRMDSTKIDVDAGDVYLVLVNEIIKAQSTKTNSILVDEDSIEVHERKAKFAPPQLAPLSKLPVNRANLDGSRMITFASSSSGVDATKNPPSLLLPDVENKVDDPSTDLDIDYHLPSPTIFADEHPHINANSYILESVLSGTDTPMPMNRYEEGLTLAKSGSLSDSPDTWRGSKAIAVVPPPSPPSTLPFGSRQTPRTQPFISAYREINRQTTKQQANANNREVVPISSKIQGRRNTALELYPRQSPRGRDTSAKDKPLETADRHRTVNSAGFRKSKSTVREEEDDADVIAAPDVSSSLTPSVALPLVSSPAPSRMSSSKVRPAPAPLSTLPRILSIIEMNGKSSFSAAKPTSSPEPRDTLVVVPLIPPKSNKAIQSSQRTRPPKSSSRGSASRDVLRSTLQSQAKHKTIVTSMLKPARTRTTGVRNSIASLTGRRILPTKSSTGSTTSGRTSITPLPTPTSLIPYLPLLIHNRPCIHPGPNICSTMSLNITVLTTTVSQLRGIDIEPISDFIRQVVESGCYEFADYFVCQLLQPTCEDEKPILPCRGFCQSFLDKCKHILPEAFTIGLSCDSLVAENKGKCVGMPECVHQIRVSQQDHLVCDGIIDCYDMSDETRCRWCSPSQFLCGGKKCIEKTLRCDGKPDCPNESDERNCLALAENSAQALHAHPYTKEGYIFLNDKGAMGKICADTLLKSIPKQRREVVLRNVGESACELLNYKYLDYVDTRADSDDVGPYFHILNPLSWRVTFLEAPCQTKNVVYMGCSNFACGKRPSHSTPSMLHYLGESKTIALTDHGDWPWHIALYKDDLHTCDGTLISDQWLLTSSTCFQGLHDGQWYAKMGTVRLGSNSPFQQRRRLVGRSHSPIKGSDVALVKLETPILLTDFVRPVCIPRNDNRFPTGKKCITLGWDVSHSFPEHHLRQVTVTLSESDQCIWRWPIGKFHVFCTAEPSGSFNDCQSEDQSGGPLLCDSNGAWYLVGIVNWRIGCGLAKQPRLYDSVSVNYNWIEATMRTYEHDQVLSHEIVDM